MASKIKIEGVIGEEKDGFLKVFFRNYATGEDKKFIEIESSSPIPIGYKKNFYPGKIGILSVLNVESDRNLKVNGIEMTMQDFADNYINLKPGTVSPTGSFAEMGNGKS